jgi:hypothetical protein
MLSRETTTFMSSKRIPLLVSFAALAFSALTMLILSVVMIVRTVPAQPILNLPERYLPGNPFPTDALFPSINYGNYPAIAYYQNKNITLAYDVSTDRITVTSISMHEYTIGDLITAWGTPIGITQNGDYTWVYWGTRSAFLLPNSFQPTSRVAVIMYTLELFQSSSWRGFPSGKH